MHAPNKILKHFTGDCEVGDYTIFHRPDGLDVPWGTSNHFLGTITDGQDAAIVTWARIMADGDYRGFIKDDPFVTLVHEGVGGAKVNGEVTGKEPFKYSPRRHDQQGTLRPLGSARTNTRTTKITLFIGTSSSVVLG
jgi:hypothetical protein